MTPVDEPGTLPEIIQMPSPNHFDGRAGHQPVAIVLHTMGGSLAGTDSWFAQEVSQVSAHYGVGLDGRIHQYVALEDGSWANGILEAGNVWPGPAGVNPNYLTVSIETEDLGHGDQPVTDAQFDAVLRVCRDVVLPKYQSIRYLVSHRAISPKTRPVCCGPRWVASGRFQALADALHLAAIA